MITKEEVKHIAKLARLGLTEKEIEKFQKELSSILDYFEKLKGVDVSEVKSEIQPVEIGKAAREDEESSKFNPSTKLRVDAEQSRSIKVQSSKLLDLAPETKDGYLKVKSIF